MAHGLTTFPGKVSQKFDILCAIFDCLKVSRDTSCTYFNILLGVGGWEAEGGGVGWEVAKACEKVSRVAPQ